MSEENYYVVFIKGSVVRLNLFEAGEGMLKKARRLIWKDIKEMKLAIVAIACYLWISRVLWGGSCIWVMITGFPCPGCGLTRAARAILHGEFKEAFQIHPFIYGIILLLFFMFVWRYLLQRSQKVFVKWGVVLFAGMLVFYVYRMIYQFPGEPPMSYYRHNMIRAFLAFLK